VACSDPRDFENSPRPLQFLPPGFQLNQASVEALPAGSLLFYGKQGYYYYYYYCAWLIIILLFADDFVPTAKGTGDLNRVINYASRHSQVTVLLVVHGLVKNHVYTELLSAPLVLFTYSGHSWNFLKRAVRDRGLGHAFTQAYQQQVRSSPSPYALGLVDWARGFLIGDLLKLLGPGASSLMWKEEREYIIHAAQEPCPNQAVVAAAAVDTANTGEEELAGFPWGPKALRLLKFLRAKGVVGPHDDTVHGLPLVDFLKGVVCCKPPGARPPSQQQEKILKILKKIKAGGVLIPAAYILNKTCSQVFWRGP